MDEWTPDILKEHYDAIFEERRRYYDAIFAERRQYYDSLFEERLRALEAGDRALEGHITNQIAQVRDALAASNKMVDIAFAASEKAISKTDNAMEKRFESVNEFRAQLNDQTATFLPRETYDATVASWTLWRESVEKRMAEKDALGAGSEKTLKWIGWGLGVVSTFIAILAASGHL